MTELPPPAWVAACAGGVSGFIQVCAEQPFDTIKTRLQSRGISPAFDGVGGAVVLTRNTFSTEGPRAFFQGITPRLLTYSAVKFSLFNLYETFRASDALTGGSPALAGALAGGLNSLLSCPQEFLKAQLQVQIAAGPGAYRGPLWTARHLHRAHGIAAFWRGLAPLALRDTLGYAVLYSSYTTLKGLSSSSSGPMGIIGDRAASSSSLPAGISIPSWICGGVSGVLFYLAILPIDRCKTIIMTHRVAPGEAPLSLTAAFHGVLASRQGWAGFYRGCQPTLARTFCGQAVALSTYDSAREFFIAHASSSSSSSS